MGYITDIYAGFSFASTCPFPDTTFADGENICAWSHQFSYSTDPNEIPADQTNYRAVITEACFSTAQKNEFFAHVQSAGEDIRVTLSDGETEIPFAVVYIDKVTQKLELHARITGTTSSTVATTLRIYTGNLAASAYALNATYGQYNCFQDLQYYLTFRQDPSGGILTDLTGNLGNWTIQNMLAGQLTTQANGMGAYAFDDTDDRLYKDQTYLNNVGAVTAMVKINSVLGADGAEVIWGYGGSANTANFGVMVITKRRNAGFGDTNTRFDFYLTAEGVAGNATNAAVSDAIVNGSTYLLSVVGQGAGLANPPLMYVDGTQKATIGWSGSKHGRWFDDAAPAGTPRLAIGQAYNDGVWRGNVTDDTIGPVFQEATIPSADLQATRGNNYLTPGTFGQITGWIQS